MTLLRTHILNVGHGDTIILELPDAQGRQVLGVIDCDNFSNTKQYLQNKNITPQLVRFVVATHPHYDHIGGIQDLLEMWDSQGVEVEMFWDSGHEHSSQTYQDLIKYLEKHSDITTWYPRTGMSVIFDKVELRALAPPDPLITDTASDCNNASIVLLISYGKARLLFAGDAQFANWAQISVNQQRWMSAQVLKVSHHGSKHGTFLEALEAINPSYAIISSGQSKDYKDGSFPHAITVESLKELTKTKIYCTYDHGNVIIESRTTGTHTIITEK